MYDILEIKLATPPKTKASEKQESVLSTRKSVVPTKASLKRCGSPTIEDGMHNFKNILHLKLNSLNFCRSFAEFESKKNFEIQ